MKAQEDKSARSQRQPRLESKKNSPGPWPRHAESLITTLLSITSSVQQRNTNTEDQKHPVCNHSQAHSTSTPREHFHHPSTITHKEVEELTNTEETSHTLPDSIHKRNLTQRASDAHINTGNLQRNSHRPPTNYHSTTREQVLTNTEENDKHLLTRALTHKRTSTHIGRTT